MLHGFGQVLVQEAEIVRVFVLHVDGQADGLVETVVEEHRVDKVLGSWVSGQLTERGKPFEY